MYFNTEQTLPSKNYTNLRNSLLFPYGGDPNFVFADRLGRKYGLKGDGGYLDAQQYLATCLQYAPASISLVYAPYVIQHCPLDTLVWKLGEIEIIHILPRSLFILCYSTPFFSSLLCISIFPDFCVKHLS